MVLLVTILFSVSALSATDTNDNTTTADVSSSNVVNTESNTNIESNSIKNTVSNEYETITNESSSNDNAIIKKTSTNTINTKTSSKPEVNIETNTITAYANQLITIKASVNYQNGEKVSDAKVAIKINGKTIGHTNVNNGIITYNYELPKWHAKEYNLTIKVGETSSTSTTTHNSSLFIKRHNVEIDLDDYTCYSADKVQLKAIVKYENGTYADGTKTVFKINQKTVGSTTVNKGVALISYVVPTKAKTYSLLFKIGESTVSLYNESTAKLTVKKRTPTINLDKMYFAKSGKTFNLKVKVTNTGYADASGKLGLKIDGKTADTVQMTDSTATFSYNAGKLKKGNHNITVVYGGSNALYETRKNSTLRVLSDSIGTYTYSQIVEKANITHEFILNNNRLPNYVTIEDKQLKMADWAYLFAMALSYNESFHNGDFSAPTSSAKTSGYDIQIYKEDYTKLAQSIADSYIALGHAPTYIKTQSNVTLSFSDSIYVLAKTLSFVNRTGLLPNYVTVLKINSSSGSSSSSSSSSGGTSYIIDTDTSGYKQYLVSATNAYVNSTTLKNAVKKALSGVSGTYNKAVAIFNYVNDNTDYSFYMNTRYGALGTLSRGYGNCVDQSHVLLGMYRTAGLPARYCHATCYFTSGLVVGHVWVEVNVNGKWYQCDTTSNRNSFGKIVNWYKSSTVRRYAVLSF